MLKTRCTPFRRKNKIMATFKNYNLEMSSSLKNKNYEFLNATFVKAILGNKLFPKTLIRRISVKNLTEKLLQKKFLFYSLVVFVFLPVFFSCKTTKINDEFTEDKTKQSVAEVNEISSSVVVEKELVFDDLTFTESVKLTALSECYESEEKKVRAEYENIQAEEYKYVFLRIYNPVYSNPFYIANILKGGIKITLVTDDDYSHSAINFSLDDNFYGLTSGGKYQLARESCVRPKENKYMKHGNPKKSTQVTYALKVTPYEYEYLREFVKLYEESPDVRYSVFVNFQIGFFIIDRKFFTSKEKQQFGDVKYPKSSISKKKQSEYTYVENHFVCSTFIAYAFENCIEKIGEWFKKHNVNYRYVNVPDLIYIPGMTKLFSSTWEDYEYAALQFVEEYPEFSDYLNKF